MRAFLLILGVIFLLAPSGADACPKGKGGKHGMGHHGGMGMDGHAMMMAAERMGLEEALLKKMRDKVFEAEKKGIELEAQMKRQRLALHHAMMEDSAKDKKIMRLSDALGDTMGEMRRHRLKLMLDMRGMLPKGMHRKMLAMAHGGEGKSHGHAHHRGPHDAPKSCACEGQ